jgi:hypothetical protein
MRETVEAARKTLRDLVVTNQKPAITVLNTVNVIAPSSTHLNPRNPGSV